MSIGFIEVGFDLFYVRNDNVIGRQRKKTFKLTRFVIELLQCMKRKRHTHRERDLIVRWNVDF